MSYNLPVGRDFTSFPEFKYYGSLIFSYKKNPGRSQVGSDFEAAERFFKDYLSLYNRKYNKSRELIFTTDDFEIDCINYFRITATLKPELLKKPRIAKNIGSNSASGAVSPESVDITSQASAESATAAFAADSTGGGGQTTPPDPKGPPPSSVGITAADAEQNF